MQNFRQKRRRAFVRALRYSSLASIVLTSACASSSSGGSSDAGEPQPKLMTETALTLDLALDTPARAEEAGGAGGASQEPQATTLEVTAKDGSTPLVTDLWLYTLDDDGQTAPLTDFTSTAERKSRSLMLPAKIGGKSAGLTPADDGVANGTMTTTKRGALEQGRFVSIVDGTVTITLPAPPTRPILVVAGVEDQRYAGAAAINPDGSAADVPDGFGALETHPLRSYAKDVAPLLKVQCMTACHNPSGPNGAAMYVMDSRDHLVNDNFGFTEGTSDCAADNDVGTPEYEACVQAITSAEFLVEPGAPALTGLLTRALPDAEGGTSEAGLLWYGGGTPKSRFNAKYGDRRMPSTSISLDSKDWRDLPTYFDQNPQDFQVLYDWVAQGAQP